MLLGAQVSTVHLWIFSPLAGQRRVDCSTEFQSDNPCWGILLCKLLDSFHLAKSLSVSTDRYAAA
jgi:hypothetical protein